MVAVGAELEVVAPVLNAHAQARVAAREVVVEEGVGADHVAIVETTHAHTQVGLVAVIGAVDAALGEEQVFFCVVYRQQQVERRAGQGELVIDVDLHAGGAEAAQPFLGLGADFAGRHATGHGRGCVALVDVRGEEVGGAAGHAGELAGLFFVLVVQRLAGHAVGVELRQGHARGAGHFQAVAWAQVVEAIGEDAELVERTQLSDGHVETGGHALDGFAGGQGVKDGMLSLRGTRLLIAGGTGVGGGEGDGQRQGGLDGDVHPGQRSG